MSNILSDNQDTYLEFNTRVRQLSIKVQAEHVKGHINGVSDKLTNEQALNQLMDTKVGVIYPILKIGKLVLSHETGLSCVLGGGCLELIQVCKL